jgi:hypothetical protein
MLEFSFLCWCSKLSSNLKLSEGNLNYLLSQLLHVFMNYQKISAFKNLFSRFHKFLNLFYILKLILFYF